jgi:AcrR family transcriptional regulator
MAVRLTRGERKERTRAQLVRAARRVFIRRGFHGASLDEIAEEAGFTKGAVYSNFRGKDELFLAVLEEHYAERTRVYAQLVLEEGDLEATRRAIARFMLEAHAREPAWWTLVSDFTTHAARDPELRERLGATREQFLDALAGIIETFCGRYGITHLLPAREVARGTGALMRGMVMEWALDPASDGKGDFEEMVAAYLRGLAVPVDERST